MLMRVQRMHAMLSEGPGRQKQHCSLEAGPRNCSLVVCPFVLQWVKPTNPTVSSSVWWRGSQVSSSDPEALWLSIELHTPTVKPKLPSPLCNIFQKGLFLTSGRWWRNPLLSTTHLPVVFPMLWVSRNYYRGQSNPLPYVTQILWRRDVAFRNFIQLDGAKLEDFFSLRFKKWVSGLFVGKILAFLYLPLSDSKQLGLSSCCLLSPQWGIPISLLPQSSLRSIALHIVSCASCGLLKLLEIWF